MRRLILTSKAFVADRMAPRRPRRRRGLPRLRRWALRLGGSALVLGAVGGLGAWAWHSGWAAEQAAAGLALIHAQSAAAGLSVQDVLVEGRRRTPRADLRAALGVARGTSMLRVDPAAARERLERLPLVDTAVVERRLPDRLYVRLRERVPMAIWQLHGRLRVIDRQGRIVRGLDPANHARLPLVVGEGAPADTARLLRVLRERPALAGRVEAAVRVSARRWNLRMTNGVDVQLPERGIAEAWNELARLEARYAVLQRDIAAIDLRLPDRLSVRMAPDAEPVPEAAGGKST